MTSSWNKVYTVILVLKPADPMYYATLHTSGLVMGLRPLNPQAQTVRFVPKTSEVILAKSKIVTCRFSESEYADLKTKADSVGVSVSGLIRESVTKVRAWTPTHTAVEKERVRQVARIGNNLNQIARAVNQQGVVKHELDILSRLQSIHDDLRKSLGIVGPDAY